MTCLGPIAGLAGAVAEDHLQPEEEQDDASCHLQGDQPDPETRQDDLPQHDGAHQDEGRVKHRPERHHPALDGLHTGRQGSEQHHGSHRIDGRPEQQRVARDFSGHRNSGSSRP
jgi:hypothetical protein